MIDPVSLDTIRSEMRARTNEFAYPHFNACLRSSDPMSHDAPALVASYVHHRNGDQVVDIGDAGMLAACVTTNGVGTEKGSGSFCRDGPTGAPHKRCLTPFPSLNDYTGLQGCQGSSASLCTFVFDWNANGTVDNFDAAAFQQKIGHPGVPHPVFSTSSSYGNPFMWTGQRYDAAVGLYHFLYRSYSPTLGRWLQRDPLGYVAGASLYEHANSTPLQVIDPSSVHSVGPAGSAATRGGILSGPSIPQYVHLRESTYVQNPP